MDAWLIRTSAGWIKGPFSKEELLLRIGQNELTGSDEVCHANDFWFFLSDAEEVQKNFGIPALASLSENSEDGTTTTEAPTISDFRIPGHFHDATELESHLREKMGSAPLDIPKNTSPPLFSSPAPPSKKYLEGLSFWRGIAFFLLFFLAFILLAIVRAISIF